MSQVLISIVAVNTLILYLQSPPLMKRSVFVITTFILTIQLFGQPTINSFTPASGPIGTSVTVSGTNFNTTPSQDIVYFGAVRAVVSAATPTSLTVTVRPGATYQPITVTTNNLTAASNLPFNVTFNGDIGPFTSNSFLAKSNITLGKNLFAVASGDFDGDGKADLLIPLGNSDTVSLLKNTSSAGNISFSSPLNIKTTGTDNEECAIGDLDWDGKLDFVITNGIGSNSFSAFRNTSSSGNLSFASKIDFPATSVPTYVSVADLNGDGKPDVALANSGTTTISTYINTSTATTFWYSHNLKSFNFRKINGFMPNQPTVRHGKICYIEMPAADVERSATFYKTVFDWNIRKRGDGATAFDDTIGEVSGAWVLNRKPMTEVGLLFYIMVDSVEQTIEKLLANGGKLIQPIGMDAPEITARFSDPAGNIIGLYQEPKGN
jgi:predicted enzyme related to lactoylglutathione lyase